MKHDAITKCPITKKGQVTKAGLPNKTDSYTTIPAEHYQLPEKLKTLT